MSVFNRSEKQLVNTLQHSQKSDKLHPCHCRCLEKKGKGLTSDSHVPFSQWILWHCSLTDFPLSIALSHDQTMQLRKAFCLQHEVKGTHWNTAYNHTNIYCEFMMGIPSALYREEFHALKRKCQEMRSSNFQTLMTCTVHIGQTNEKQTYWCCTVSHFSMIFYPFPSVLMCNTHTHISCNEKENTMPALQIAFVEIERFHLPHIIFPYDMAFLTL